MPILPMESSSLPLFDWFLKTSIRASILIVFLLLVKLALKNKISARLHYILWFVVIAALLLPSAPQSSFSIYNFMQPMVQQVMSASAENSDKSSDDLSYNLPAAEISGAMTEKKPQQPVLNNNSTVINPSVSELTEVSLPFPQVSNNKSSNNIISPVFALILYRILFLIWLIGILVLMISTIVINRRFIYRIQGQTVKDQDIITTFDEARKTLNIKPKITLVWTTAVKTPALFGLFRPKLLIPDGVLNQFSLTQFHYIFIHELLHYRRKDMLVRWLIYVLSIIHWFNPFIWYAFAKMREDQEMACDELALSRLGADKSTEYGATLLLLLESASRIPRLVNVTGLAGSGSKLKRRIIKLKHYRKSSWLWATLTLMIVAAIITFTLTNAKADVPLSSDVLTPDANKNEMVLVNSLEPISYNQELVDQAKNSEDVSEFLVSNNSDVASIAYGRMLKAQASVSLDEQPKDFFYPVAPIKVKSYEWRYPDYYIVPFVQDGKFVAQSILSTDRQNTGYLLFEESGYIDPVSELFNIDAKEAMQIIQSEKGISQPPVPRLVFHTELTHFTQQNSDLARREPTWEFDLPDHTKLYVNQYGEVLDKNIIPWYETITGPQYNPQAVKTQANQLIRNDGWDLQVEKIEFGRPIPNDERHRMVSIYLIAENQAGQNQLFMPKGSIVSLKSAGGKIYPLQPVPINNIYISMQQLRIEENRQEIKPGQVKFAHTVEADVLDNEFTEVTYRDELGNEFKIPLDLTPVPVESDQPNKKVMKPYPIPGKNWSIAITRLEFRTGTWQDKKLAALELTVSNNDGADKTFLPTGKVIGLVGTSGKLYPDHDSTLDENYRGLEKSMAEKGQTLARPGILVISPEILVDADEKNFTQIIYEDETGEKFTIPVQGIKPIDR